MSFYAYIYRDGDTPIYVGKGKRRRAYVHLKNAPNLHLRRKIAKMAEEGKLPSIEIIPALDEDHAYFLESCLIEVIGRKDQGKGPLLNMTDGGDGGAQVFTDSYREKLREAGHRRVQSESTRAKIAASNSKPLTEARKANISAARKANRVTCPHCGKEGNVSGMKRYHFHNCKARNDKS